MRVAVVRDEEGDLALTRALDAAGLIPVPCPVHDEHPPADVRRLLHVARTLESFDWLIAASGRAVRAITRARGAALPTGLRTAAVGQQTAHALTLAGAYPLPVTAERGGAEPLLETLLTLRDWSRQRVACPTTPGGRTTLADGLARAGASVTAFDAYELRPRGVVAIGETTASTDFTAAAEALRAHA
jgi:uroporphyrinogen-III synthase